MHTNKCAQNHTHVPTYRYINTHTARTNTWLHTCMLTHTYIAETKYVLCCLAFILVLWQQPLWRYPMSSSCFTGVSCRLMTVPAVPRFSPCCSSVQQHMCSPLGRGTPDRPSGGRFCQVAEQATRTSDRTRRHPIAQSPQRKACFLGRNAETAHYASIHPDTSMGHLPKRLRKCKIVRV